MRRSSKAPGIPDMNTKQESYAYHAHDWREVLSILGAHEEGLTTSEIEKRQSTHGTNTFASQKEPSVFSKVISQLRSPLAFVLVIAFGITFLLAEYIDAGVIAAALCIAVAVGIFQEGKASRAFSTLAESQTKVATVVRNGNKHEIKADDLTVGDIVVLQSGMQVPADLRLFRAKQLSVNEATLTGEWRSVDKQTGAVQAGTPFAERSSMAWMGTYVAEGYGMGVVVAIGEQTVVGQLAKDVREVIEVKTPLQEEMERISKIMLYIIIALVMGIFILGVVEGHTLNEMLLTSIAIAVASVPEGLPAAVTIILAVGMESLLKRGGLVRNLLAAETLGSTTYVLTDKTGTLTEAKMAVAGVITGHSEYCAIDNKREQPYLKELLAISLAATDAYTDVQQGTKVVRGDSVEQAILAVANQHEVGEKHSKYRRERIDYLAFTSELRFAAGLSELADDDFFLAVNGAPGIILDNAALVCQDGTIEPLSQTFRDDIRSTIDSYTNAGKRLIGVGYKKVDYDDIPEHDPTLLEDLIFMGILVLDDPVRKGVKKAIAGVQEAGAEVILITGDNPDTARSIAVAVGITSPEGAVLTGDDLEQLSDNELLVALANVRVFARVLPKQKLRVATLLQQKGEVVAMTGDGINDAPALRRADIGVAVGSGTEVAKEASDLILVKDSFSTIYSAIEEGRRIIANLRKIVGYLLSTSLSEVVLIGTALLVSAPVPILPAQILWANVIEEGLMSVAFAFEKGDKNAMKRKPQDIHAEGILSRDMMWFIAFVVSVLGMLTIALYLYVLSLDLPLETVRSIMFLSVAVDSLFISFAFRSLTVPLWQIPLSNNWFFVGSFFISTALLFVVLAIPFFQRVLSYQPLELTYIAMVVGFSLASLAVVEIGKWFYFERQT